MHLSIPRQVKRIGRMVQQRIVVFESLRARLMLLVLLAVIPALVLALSAGLEQRRLAAANVHDEALRLGHVALADQTGLVDHAGQLLATLAQLPVVRGERGSACNSFLADVDKRYWSLTGIVVVQPDGAIACSSIPAAGMPNLAGRDWFKQVLQTKQLTIGQYSVAAFTGKPTLILAYPILDQAEQVQGVVAAGLDLTHLSLFGSATQLPPDSTVTLIDRDGTVVARYPDSERWVGRSMPEVPIVREVLTRRAEGTAQAIGVDGKERLFAFVPLQAVADQGQSGDADLYIVVGIPTQVAFADVNRVVLRNLAGLGLVAVLALVSAWLVGDLFIMRPVNVLSAAMARVATADFSGRVGPPYSAGELGQLARIFDQSIRALEQHESERKRAEQAQRESEAYWRALIQHTSDIVIVLDDEGTIRYASPAVQRILGYDPQSLVGENSFAFIHPEDVAGVKRSFSLITQSPGILQSAEFRYRHVDGSWRILEAIGKKLPQDLQASSVVVNLRDVTKRRQMEDELAEMQHRLTEAREAERLLMAQELHDGPVQDLVALDFRLVNLEETAANGNGSSDLQRIRATVQQVNRTLRVMCGELRPPTLTPFGLTVAIRSHATRLQQEHPELEIGLHLTPDGDALPERMRLALFRIYQHAMDNVLQHAGASHVLVRFSMDATQVVLEVRDNGRGFEVPDRWISLARAGHLGVAGIRERADSIDGTLSVESQPGQGTVVRVMAPRPLQPPNGGLEE
jgi:PAS domain S-box-containing protein